jgi:SAM-dependent methyltransferase
MTDQRRFYTQALSDGLNEAQQVGWESIPLQRLRFEALLEALDPDDLRRPTTRLLDVGCGMGALYAHLRATGRPVQYLGIDLCPELIDAARARYPAAQFPDAQFRCADALRWAPAAPFDVVICSGALSLRFDPRARANWRLVDRMLGMARWAVALNLQASQPGEGDLDRRFWLVRPADAWRSLSRRCPRLSLRHDVLPGELVAHLYPGDYTRTLRAQPWRDLATPEDTAEALLQQEQHQAAAALLSALPKLNPRAATLLGIALSHLDDFDAALDLLSQAHALRPADLTCAESLLRLLLDPAAPDLKRALAVLDAALTASRAAAAPPAARDALRLLTHQALLPSPTAEPPAQPSPKRARAAAALAQAAETPPAAALMRARAAAAALTPDAPDRYADAAALQPWDCALTLEHAAALINAGRPADALPLLHDVLRLDRHDPTAATLLHKATHPTPAPPQERP